MWLSCIESGGAGDSNLSRNDNDSLTAIGENESDHEDADDVGDGERDPTVLGLENVRHGNRAAKKALKIVDQGAPPMANVAPKPRQGAPSMVDVAPKPCQGAQSEPSSCKHAAAVVTKGKKKEAPKADLHDRLQHVQALKIATHSSQDAPTPVDVAREPCQGAPLKKAPKVPKALKAPKSAPKEAPKAPKTPKEANKKIGKTNLNVVEGSGVLKAQKSGQVKEVSGTAGTEPRKTRVCLYCCQGLSVNKRKSKVNAKEKEGAVVLEQHNVKKLKKMKEVGVREVVFEQKLAVVEVKVKNKRKGHMGKGQLEKGSEDKIIAKRDGMKKKGKKHVVKGLEDNGLADKAHALVGSSMRSKLQGKRPKQLVASCTASTIVTSKMSNEKPYFEVFNGAMDQMGMLVAQGNEDKSNGGSDDGGDEDDGSSQDGGGDNDSNYGSNDHASDDDGGSDNSGGGDDNADGEDDGTDDKDDTSGSDEGDSEGASERDEAQDVSTDDEGNGIRSARRMMKKARTMSV
ncbi:hypothetical protein L7F22_056793 [Adiantum nelumboides]|nr:hypothetical protein [Adiantum nelumboides]